MYETGNQKDRDKKRVVLRDPRCQRLQECSSQHGAMCRMLPIRDISMTSKQMHEAGKKAGMTQEQLSEKLLVTKQAVRATPHKAFGLSLRGAHYQSSRSDNFFNRLKPANPHAGFAGLFE